MRRIRVLLADDHSLVRHGIRALLERAEDIQVVAEAGDGREALDLAILHLPDVAIVDIAMPRMDGLQAIQQIRALNGDTRLIVLSMYSDPALVRRALQLGATGYLLKSSVPDELLLAVRSVARGDVYLSPPVAQPIVRDFLETDGAPGQAAPWGQLTPREREVLQLVAQGRTNASIADKLGVSVKTIEKHRSNLMVKLEAHSLAELVAIAARQRLVFEETNKFPGELGSS